MRRPWVTVCAGVAGPPAVASIVVVLGDLGALGWPPAPSGWPDWLVSTDPAVALVATMRAAIVAACALTSLRIGLAIVIAALVLPRTRHPRRSVAPPLLADALGRIARPAVAAGLGVGLISSTAMATAATALDGRSAAPSAPSPDADVLQSPIPIPSRSFAEMRRLQFELAPFAAVPDPTGPTEVWVVERGDHFWSIAHEVLAEHLGAPPRERRIARYWKRLIEANSDRLAIPGEPDVIIPGQRLILPPLTAPDQRSGT